MAQHSEDPKPNGKLELDDETDAIQKKTKQGPRKRVSQACDRCRSRKDKCDGKKPVEPLFFSMSRGIWDIVHRSDTVTLSMSRRIWDIVAN